MGGPTAEIIPGQINTAGGRISMPIPSPPTTVSVRARRKIAWRILPFIFVLYIIAYLDRANVAFVKLSMTTDLGFSDAVFGLGAGIFFIGYFLLEIPGALIVERWSARRWLARILVTWGVCTVLVGFARTAQQFYAARFLLGAAEAGFFPGVIVYLSHWFRRQDRARATARFVMAAPVSLVLGAPLSALILKINWWDVPGWRWVFILEGLPAICFGFVTLYYLTDRPAQAAWLSPQEREWISSELELERLEKKRSSSQTSILASLRQRNVILLTAASFLANIGGYGFIVWLPTRLKRVSGLSIPLATAASAFPFVLALVFIWLNGRSSDRADERRLHAGIPLLLAGIFQALSVLPNQSAAVTLGWMFLTGAAIFAWVPAFWVLPTLILGEAAAAASIGLINSIGNLGGFVGPSVVGYFSSRQLPEWTGVIFLAACYWLSAAFTLRICLPLPKKARPDV
jgi:MFS transporter, ACS family, tartrate transporter